MKKITRHFGKIPILIIGLSLAWASLNSTSSIQAQDQKNKQLSEYKIKAALIYNLLKYTKWPEKKKNTTTPKWSDPEEKFIIGVIGDDPFKNAWSLIEGQKVQRQSITVKQFGSYPANEDLQKVKKLKKEIAQCKVLFIAPSDKDHVKDIVIMCLGHNIMLISEYPGFLEVGGTINLLKEDNKVQFEVNLDSAKNAQLKINTTVLKLAKRILQKQKE